MVRSVEAVYKNGKVELLEPAPEHTDGRVIVTFMTEPAKDDLSARGISQNQAAELRARLAAFAEDWERPDMEVYDAL